jgi:c-di-GMP-binding flagellar brake protein YcgR
MRRSVRVDCQVVRERDFRLIGQRAVDLSDGGMLVLSEAHTPGPAREGRRLHVLTGEEVIVSFRAPTTRLWFDCTATVARVIHGRRPGDWGACVGLSFESMDDVTRAFLRAELRGLPPPMPGRELRLDYAETVRRAAYSA